MEPLDETIFHIVGLLYLTPISLFGFPSYISFPLLSFPSFPLKLQFLIILLVCSEDESVMIEPP
jgi:hypothetical protein